MTDTKKLELLADYQFFAYSVTSLMLNAYEYHEEGETQHSWSCLFAWRECIDMREKAWEKVSPHHVDAIYLKEGVT